MKTETEQQPIVVIEDEIGRRWIAVKDASKLMGIPTQTLYSAAYREVIGGIRPIPHRYIKNSPRSIKGHLYLDLQATVEWKTKQIFSDTERVETELKAVLQQYGISREEADAIVASYEKAFEKVIGEVRAKELEGVITNGQAIVV